MAQAFPKSHFNGFDHHLWPIEWARIRAATEGRTENADLRNREGKFLSTSVRFRAG